MKRMVYLLIIFSSINVYAQSLWKKLNGPVGGVIQGLYIKNDTLLAGTGINNGLIFYSTNAGASWKQAALNIPDGIVSFIDTEDGGFLASAGYGGIFKSSDLVNWEQLYNDNRFRFNFGRDNYGTLYNGDYRGIILQSSDNGNNWIASLRTGDPWSIGNFLLNKDSILYAGGNDRLFVKRPGEEWEIVFFNIIDQMFNPLLDDENNLFAYAYQFLLRYDRADDKWEEITGDNFINREYVKSMIYNERLIAALNDETGFFGYHWGVAVSDDKGYTWRQHNEGLPPKFSSASRLVKSGSDTYLGTNAAGVFKSTDFGENWFPVNNGITSATAKDIYIDDEGIIYTASWSNGIQKSSDKGESWEVINNGLTNSYCYSVIADDDGVLYAGTDQGTFRSSDKGKKWERTSSPGNDFVFFFEKDSYNRFYALTYGSGLYRTDDLGESWLRLDKNWESGYVFGFLEDRQNNLYAGTRGGIIYKSTDDGHSWVSVYKNSNPNSVVSDIELSPDGTVYAACVNEGILRSRNGGREWVKLNSGIPLRVKQIEIDSRGLIFASIAGSGIYYSKDDGDNWMDITGSTAEIDIDRILIDKNDNVYLATDESVWRSNPDSAVTAAEEIRVIENYSLSQNYPNPFNPSTKIKYQIPEADYVTLKVYDILGREAAVLVDKFQSPGEYETEFRAGTLSSGIYFYKLTAGKYTAIKKLQLLK